MGVLVGNDTKLVIQGITGRDGSFHAHQMSRYGTKVVAGVTPGKGGQNVEGIPVFNTVSEAVESTGANTSCIFVPARFAADAVYESADAGIKLIITITEGVPVLDMIKAVKYIQDKGARLIGPNCPGIITPGEAKIGILPDSIFEKGKVGVVSRSGTLTYEIVSHITKKGFGESTAVGIGGDPIIGTKFIDMLELFKNDPQTEAIVLIGEIGGTDEEDTARYVTETNYPKPIIGFIAGRTAPPGKRMGHAGAIISGGKGTAEEKIRAFENANIKVASVPDEIGTLLEEVL